MACAMRPGAMPELLLQIKVPASQRADRRVVSDVFLQRFIHFIQEEVPTSAELLCRSTLFEPKYYY